jgi:hypothetical protein
MADTFTPNVGFVNQTEGGNDNTWGIKTDDNWELADDKLGDLTSITTTGGTTALTDDQQDVAAIKVSGTLVSNSEVVLDGRGGFWIVWNNTSGAFTVTFKVSGQTGVTVSQGVKTLIWCDGTDIRDGVSAFELLSDTSPQLGGNLDANGFDILVDDATGIKDDSGNELVRFQKTASAINQIDITNAAIAGSPRIDATGDDTNISLTLAGKGTGGVVAVFKSSLGLGILDSDSSHGLFFRTNSNLSVARQLTFTVGDADRTIQLDGNLTVSGAATLPAGTALVQANNLSDVANAATAFGNIKQAASDSATGAIEIAVQSEMKAASDTARAVTPGRQHFHPGHPKAGGMLVGTGTPAFAAGDYGMGAVTDNGTGNYDLAFDTAFNDTNYWGEMTGRGTSGDGPLVAGLNFNDTKTESVFEISCVNLNGTPRDPGEVGVTFWGDYG